MFLIYRFYKYAKKEKCFYFFNWFFPPILTFHSSIEPLHPRPSIPLSSSKRNADANGLIEFRLSKDGFFVPPMPVPGSCCAMNQKQGASASDVIIEISILRGYLAPLSRYTTEWQPH